jgi:hypothetical protein
MCEMVASWQCEHGSRGMPVVGSRYLAMTGEDIEAVVLGVMICRVCRFIKLLQLPVVTSYKC